VFGIAVCDLFLILILRNMDVHRVIAEVASIRGGALWLVPAVIVYFAAIWVRTTRWGYILNPVKRCTTKRLFPIYVISYMANNVLPLRMGDVYRAYIVGKREGVRKAAALITVAVERVFDGLTMLLFLLIASLFFPFPEQIRETLRVGGIAFLGILLICYVLLWRRRATQALIERLLPRLPAKHQTRVRVLVDSLFTGLAVLQGPRDLLGVTLYSVITWGLEAGMYGLTLNAFGIAQPPYVSLTLLAVVNLFIIVPGPPGYFGPFEAACVLVLGAPAFGVRKEMALAFALILHVVGQWIPSTALGLFYMWREHISFGEVPQSDKEAEIALGTTVEQRV
jgi:glycosyltransferase 2 family protein